MCHNTNRKKRAPHGKNINYINYSVENNIID